MKCENGRRGTAASIAQSFLEIIFPVLKKRFLELLRAPESGFRNDILLSLKKHFLELLGAHESGFRLDAIFDSILMLWILVRLSCHELLK